MNRLMELEVLAIDVTPEAPPGSDSILKVLGWGAWIGSALGIGGIMIVAVMMFKSNRRGEGGESATALGWVLAGLILFSAAGAVAGILLPT